MKSEVDGIVWRPYRQSEIYHRDMDAMVRLQAETEEALGQEMDLPDQMKPPVLGTWVAERAQEIVGACYLEAVAELCFVGTDPRVSVSAKGLADALALSLTNRGFRQAKVFVPTWAGTNVTIGKALESVGFSNVSRVYDHYERLLRKPKGS